MPLLILIRQLCTVLDRLLARATQKVHLSPDDALIIAWLSQDDGAPAAQLARYLCKKRQSMQRTLERLEESGLVRRYGSLVRKTHDDERDLTVGWGLTEEGKKTWESLSRAFDRDEETISRDEDLRRWRTNLECLIKAVSRAPEVQANRLMEPPASESTAEWDL